MNTLWILFGLHFVFWTIIHQKVLVDSGAEGPEPPVHSERIVGAGVVVYSSPIICWFVSIFLTLSNLLILWIVKSIMAIWVQIPSHSWHMLLWVAVFAPIVLWTIQWAIMAVRYVRARGIRAIDPPF